MMHAMQNSLSFRQLGSRVRRVFVVVPLVLGSFACAGSGPGPRDLVAANEGRLAIVETALVLGNCGRFAAAVERAGLREQLEEEGPFTVLVPVDQAWEQFAAGEGAELRRDPERLRELLLHHVIRGEVRAARLVHMEALEPLVPPRLSIAIVEQRVRIGDAFVARGDVTARNGVLHFVDRVLVPPGSAR